MTTTPLFSVDNVTQVYAQGRHQVHALRHVSLQIAAGEFLALAGPSGSGKTTLLNLLGLLDVPTQGSIGMDGRPTETLSEPQRNAIRRDDIGFVFQSFNLIPVLTAYENVEYFAARRLTNHEELHACVTQALEAVGLASLSDQRPLEMSGGERQRVAVARAMAKKPRVVLADEPTASLDHQTGQGVIDLMKQLNRDQGVTFVFSTHDPKVLAAAGRVVRIEDGVIS